MHHSFHPLYVDYCIYFNGNQDYFECHEVLEEYWKKVASGDKQHILVGLIQLATGLYHWRRNNFTGATRTLQKAYKQLQSKPHSFYLTPFDQKRLLQHIETSLHLLSTHTPFQSFLLPITDDMLKKEVEQAIPLLQKQDREYIIHKHKLRDRSDILRLRDIKRSRR